MKKIRFLKIILPIFFLVLFTVPVHAADSIFEVLPKEVADQFDSVDENTQDTGQLMQVFSFRNIGRWLWKSIEKALPEFFKFLLSILGYVLIFSVLDKLAASVGSRTAVLTVKSVVNAVLLLYLFGYFSKCSAAVQKNIETIDVFCKACIPILSALLIESGKSFSASLFSYGISLSSVLMSSVSSGIFLPLIQVYIAVGSCAFLWDELHFSALTDLIKKFIKWGIGAIFSIFTFSLSLQSMLGKSADNIARKALKTAAGSIPMMGSVLSQGLDGTFTLLSGTQSAVSAIGAGTIAIIFLGTAVTLVFQYFGLVVALAVSELFDQTDCLSILKVMKGAYLILLNVFLITVMMSVVCFLIMCLGAN